MASQQEKAFCVLCFEVSRSVITVQCKFRARFRKDAPCRNNITRWGTDSLWKLDVCVKARVLVDLVSNDNSERVREAFLWKPSQVSG